MKKNRLLLFGFLCILILSLVVPFSQVYIKYKKETPAFFYYYQKDEKVSELTKTKSTKLLEDISQQENDDSSSDLFVLALKKPVEKGLFCQSFERIEKIKSDKKYLNILSSSLLLPYDLEWENNNTKKLQIQNAVFHEDTLVISFSQAFYDLTDDEEKYTITAILLTIAANAPEVKYLEVYVGENKIDLLSGFFNYRIPMRIDEYIDSKLGGRFSLSTDEEFLKGLTDLSTQKKDRRCCWHYQ